MIIPIHTVLLSLVEFMLCSATHSQYITFDKKGEAAEKLFTTILNCSVKQTYAKTVIVLIAHQLNFSPSLSRVPYM